MRKVNTATTQAKENARILAKYPTIDQEVRAVGVAMYVHLLAMLI
jgi:hypothetical protein